MNEKKKNRLQGRIRKFIQQYCRKHYPQYDPNDRTYDRKLEAQLRRMKPEDLNEPING
jgi:hypothetical protein